MSLIRVTDEAMDLVQFPIYSSIIGASIVLFFFMANECWRKSRWQMRKKQKQADEGK